MHHPHTTPRMLLTTNPRGRNGVLLTDAEKSPGSGCPGFSPGASPFQRASHWAGGAVSTDSALTVGRRQVPPAGPHPHRASPLSVSQSRSAGQLSGSTILLLCMLRGFISFRKIGETCNSVTTSACCHVLRIVGAVKMEVGVKCCVVYAKGAEKVDLLGSLLKERALPLAETAVLTKQASALSQVRPYRPRCRPA